MLTALAVAAALMGPPAPPTPDQTKPAKVERTAEQRLKLIESTLGDLAYLAPSGAFDVYATQIALSRCRNCYEAQGTHPTPNDPERHAGIRSRNGISKSPRQPHTQPVISRRRIILLSFARSTFASKTNPPPQNLKGVA
jgi:hypothetical protein